MILIWVVFCSIANADIVGYKGLRVTITELQFLNEIANVLPLFQNNTQEMRLPDIIQESKDNLITTKFILSNIMATNFTYCMPEFIKTAKIFSTYPLIAITGFDTYRISLAFDFNVKINNIPITTGRVAAQLVSISYSHYFNVSTGTAVVLINIDWSLNSLNITQSHIYQNQQLNAIISQLILTTIAEGISNELSRSISILNGQIMPQYTKYQVAYPKQMNMLILNYIMNVTSTPNNTITFAFNSTIAIDGLPYKRIITREVKSETNQYNTPSLVECYSNEMLIAFIDIQAKARYPYFTIQLKHLNLPFTASFYKNMVGMPYLKDNSEVEVGCRSDSDSEITEILCGTKKCVKIPIECDFTTADYGDNILTASISINASYSHAIQNSSGFFYYGIIENANMRRFTTDRPMGFNDMGSINDILRTMMEGLNGMEIGFPPGIGRGLNGYVYGYENADDVCFGFDN